jgi:hypothetical protein
LGQAARAVGKPNQISGTKGEFGQWCIEACELHRVYPALTDVTEGNGAGEQAVPGMDTRTLVEANARAALTEARLTISKRCSMKCASGSKT